jgi:hypothetical protein
MKTKEYLIKYSFDKKWCKFSKNEFLADFTVEFLSILESDYGVASIKAFDNKVNTMRQKWDAIYKKAINSLSEDIWNYFYSDIVCEIKNMLFPKDAKIRQIKIKEYKKQQQNYLINIDSIGLLNDFFYAIISLTSKITLPIIKHITPTNQYAVLGVNKKDGEEVVIKKYREMIKKHHPQNGGSQPQYNKITEAKNVIIAYLLTNVN